MVPLRAQAEHARSSVATYEERLRESCARLTEAEERAATLASELAKMKEMGELLGTGGGAGGGSGSGSGVGAGEDGGGGGGGGAEEALAQARAEIAGWSARQQLLLSQLAAECDASREKSSTLVEVSPRPPSNPRRAECRPSRSPPCSRPCCVLVASLLGPCWVLLASC